MKRTLVKRQAAFLAVLLFITFSLTIASPVEAHFTLGDLTSTFRYHGNDFDPHVSGVVGYVWPGGGQNAYSGFPNYASVNNPPGYQSPYPGRNPGATPGVSGNAPSSSWYQLEGDTYAPFGAVLAGTTGDLIFAINATADYATDGSGFSGPVPPPLPTRGWTGLTIALPPGFTAPDASQVVSSFTNDYAGIYVTKAGPYDRYAPGWTLVTVLADNGRNSGRGGFLTFPYYDRQTLQFTNAGEWYYVRINGVTAPNVSGRYFFKILLWGDGGFLGGPEGTTNSNCSIYRASCFGPPGILFPIPNIVCIGCEAPTQFLPTENWPVMLVKGEVDPGIITGTIRYGGYNQSLYSLPLGEAGRVYAKMTTRLDPYTGQTRPDLPLVDAVGYINATARGHYEVEGVAPGVYDLYASASGYPLTLIQSRVTILKGQSLHLDGYLQPGPVIHGNVFTKHQFGDEPWPQASGYSGIQQTQNQYIKIELYDGPTLNHVPDPKATMVSWSPLPCVAGGQESYFGWGHAGLCGDPRLGDNVAFPWHEYVPSNGYFAGISASAFNFYQVSTGTPGSVPNQIPKLTQDPQGVGPPQHWYVLGGTTTPFHFEFGVKGEYGAPRDLDGMVPQVYATWVNGLTPGRYYARAWTFRYVQSALDGSTFQEYYFDITPNEWAGDVTLPIDLRLSSWINKTVHFHNFITGLTEDPIDTGAQMMAGTLVDSNGQVWSYNQTLLGCSVPLCPGGMGYGIGPYSFGWGSPSYEDAWGLDLDRAGLNVHAIETGRANIQYWGWNDTWGGENYGIPSGTYTPHVYALGYLEQGLNEQVSVTLSGNPTSISDHMLRGAGFNVTVYSIDWQRPRVERPWVWGNRKGFDFPGDAVGQEIDVGFYSNGTLVDFMGEAASSVAGSNTRGTLCLYQGGAASCAGTFTDASVQAAGGGWNAPYRLANGTIVTYGENSNDAFFGREIIWPGFEGGYLQGTLIFETTTHLFAPFYRSTILLPTAFDTGQYDLRGYTYGYIQDKSFAVFAQRGQVADVKLNLIVGVNVTVDILFKTEHIITATNGNMSARVRLFDDSARLVAEWMSSEGTYTATSGFARAADGTNQYPFGPVLDHGGAFPFGTGLRPSPLLLNTYNFLPGGVTLLHVLMAGLPQVPPNGQDSYWAAPKGGFSAWNVIASGYNAPYFGDPIFTHKPNYQIGGSREYACDFELDCYTNPGRNWNAPGYFANTGILGAPDYQGGWTAEVDFVNWYANNTSACTPIAISIAPVFDINSQQLSGSVCNQFTNSGPQYYPPVPGLLMGESYHIIPGSTAKSGISITEDGALNSVYLGHSLAANHLGPYSQQGTWQISNAHNSGEASAIYEVDLNGLVSGNVLAFTWSNEFRPLSWGTLTVTGAGLPSTGLNFYTYDGIYQAYLPSTIGGPGSVIYGFSLNAPGYVPQKWKAAVSSGMSGTGNNLYLEQTNIPVPEFNTTLTITFSVLVTSLYLLRRKRSLQ